MSHSQNHDLALPGDPTPITNAPSADHCHLAELSVNLPQFFLRQITNNLYALTRYDPALQEFRYNLQNIIYCLFYSCSIHENCYKNIHEPLRYSCWSLLSVVSQWQNELDSLRWFFQGRRSYAHDASDAMFRRTVSLCLRFASWLSKTPHFGGCAPRRGYMIPKFELGRDFCTMHLPPSFIILCLLVRVLSCWQTNPQTHKQTDAAENIQRSSIHYDVG